MTDPFEPRPWRIGSGARLELGPRGLVMGILNVTPDSFSDGGHHADPDAAVAAARAMTEAGAAIIDIGAESTRPGAEAIDGEAERRRLLPVIADVRSALPDMPVSADTYRSETARAALEAGAGIVNDVWGLQRDPAMANLAAETGAGLVIMHTGRDRDVLPDPIEDQRVYLSRSIEIALKAGVAQAQIVLDPGFGFAKDAEHNAVLMARFGELHALGFPLLAGTSRKRFLGYFTGRPVEARDVATAASSALLRAAGAAVLRVHDVAMNVDAAAVADAMIAAGRQGAGAGTELA
ncbi:MAG: dihydropteroate synthase [Roseitalea sp.]|nr:dihydropteroate synthase [Roseitalea sp.]MBO6950528.1 dihydropteroate synthase [Rhizobiaceae bacterium]MBO6591485.1 dihydropteroate synthase [Roseitalea sp.]MBO6599340.1 dihydropteroate synthase [Roseitalea sp.]MBO6612171.1 dihydropteroate synthase [Roseitalea sp.]